MCKKIKIIRISFFLSAFFLLQFSVFAFRIKLNPNDEYIIVSGGPALLKWENYRQEVHRHDKWWGNFIRSARIRIAEIKESDHNINLTWMVYEPGYKSRSKEDNRPLISFIESVRDKYEIRLIWFSKTNQLINYINNAEIRKVLKVSGFEYFGHSNKYCFMFDYSNHILGSSKVFLHESELNKINRNAFSKGAYCRSWGCHTGESFSKAFYNATGVKMIGAIGKTDYSYIWKGELPFITPQGFLFNRSRWSR